MEQPTLREEEVEIPAIDPRVVTIREALSSVKAGFVNQAFSIADELRNHQPSDTSDHQRMVELHILYENHDSNLKLHVIHCSADSEV